MTPPTPLAELATAVSRLRRLLAEVPEQHRPPPAVAFAGLATARADVVELTAKGRHDEAHAIAADWYRQAAGPVAARLAHVPPVETRAER